MRCELVGRHLDAYVDDELESALRVEFDRHLSQCARCHGRAASLRALRGRLRERLGSQSAPAELGLRVQSALDEVDRVGRLRVWGLVAAAAAAVVLGTVTWTTIGTDFGNAPSPLALLKDVVRLHAAELPADVQSPQPQKVGSYFRGKVPFSVQPARFDSREAQLVGGRVSNVRDKGAAALYYDVQGSRMTVVVFEPPQQVELGSRQARLLGRVLKYQEIDGYTVPIRARDGLTYAFTGDLDRRALLRLAATARVGD